MGASDTFQAWVPRGAERGALDLQAAAGAAERERKDRPVWMYGEAERERKDRPVWRPVWMWEYSKERRQRD